MALSLEEYCEYRSHSGARCVYGPGHVCRCRFVSLKLSEPQVTMLTRVADACLEFRHCTAYERATAKALQNRGFAKICWHASRHFMLIVTPAGKRVVRDWSK